MARIAFLGAGNMARGMVHCLLEAGHEVAVYNRTAARAEPLVNAGTALAPGKQGFATDVCVPISRLAECIAETQKDLDSSPVVAPLVGHVGDGNFHLVYLVDPDDADELAEAKRLNERMVMRALAMDGTCTGEHGVGYGKLDFLQAEHGEAVSVMRLVKRALDPQNIMNPGKVVRV